MLYDVSIKLQDSLLLYKKNADIVLELAGVRLLGCVVVEYFSKFKSAANNFGSFSFS